MGPRPQIRQTFDVENWSPRSCLFTGCISPSRRGFRCAVHGNPAHRGRAYRYFKSSHLKERITSASSNSHLNLTTSRPTHTLLGLNLNIIASLWRQTAHYGVRSCGSSPRTHSPAEARLGIGASVPLPPRDDRPHPNLIGHSPRPAAVMPGCSCIYPQSAWFEFSCGLFDRWRSPTYILFRTPAPVMSKFGQPAPPLLVLHSGAFFPEYKHDR